MAKYFYRDVLASAWMAKHFGMHFLSGDDRITRWEAFSYLAPFGLSISHYIHPDSLHLLEPQVGDIVVRQAEGYVLADAVTAIDSDGQLYTGSLDVRRQWIGTKAGRRIIQRAGVAFHWPEVEE